MTARGLGSNDSSSIWNTIQTWTNRSGNRKDLLRGHGTFLSTRHCDIALDLAGDPWSIVMATQIVMDHNGDTRHNFDAKDANGLLKAQHRFKELTGAGFTAATRTADGEPVVTRTFDPTAEKTLFFPRLVGTRFVL